MSIRAPVVALASVLAAGSCAPQSQASNDTVLVTNEALNHVAELDGATGKVENHLVTGGRPRGMVLSPDRRTLYVAASNAGRIEVWDLASSRRVRTLGPLPGPEQFALSPDGSRIYLPSEDAGAVLFVDAASGKITRQVRTGAETEGAAVSPDGKLLVVTSELASIAQFIDTATGRLLDIVPVGQRPRFVHFARGGKSLWVSSELSGTISILDAASHRLIHRIDLARSFDIERPVQAEAIVETRDGRRLFLAMGRSNRVAEIDPATYAVVRSFPTGERTWNVALSPDEKRLYAVSGLSGTVTAIDLQRNRVQRTVELGGRPWGAVAVPK